MNRTYSELIRFQTLEERFNYVKLSGVIGDETFGSARWINQEFYRSKAWKIARNRAILRDNGCDLAHPDYSISGGIYVHHINPITLDDILNDSPCLYDLDNLICSAFDTHKAIHYGYATSLPQPPVVRFSGDTTPWKRCSNGSS